MTDADTSGLSEREYWDKAATNLRRTGLSRIRATAEKWETTIGTLLGIIGVVAFVEGPDKLNEIDKDSQAVLIGGVALAAALALFAVVLAAYAAQGVPRKFRAMYGETLAQHEAEATEQAMSFLTLSRILAILAAIILIGGTLTAWTVGLRGDDEPMATSALVVSSGGQLSCGELGATRDGLVLKDADGNTLLELDTGIVQVQTVETCPEVGQ